MWWHSNAGRLSTLSQPEKQLRHATHCTRTANGAGALRARHVERPAKRQPNSAASARAAMERRRLRSLFDSIARLPHSAFGRRVSSSAHRRAWPSAQGNFKVATMCVSLLPLPQRPRTTHLCNFRGELQESTAAATSTHRLESNAAMSNGTPKTVQHQDQSHNSGIVADAERRRGKFELRCQRIRFLGSSVKRALQATSGG